MELTLFRSPLAARVLAALTQAGPAGMSLRALARACRTGDSSVQRALKFAIGEGIVERLSGDGTTYALAEHPLGTEILTVALNDADPEDVLATVCAANSAVEFAGLDARGLLVVFRQRATATERLRLTRALKHLRPPVALVGFQHDALVERLSEDPAMRERAARSKIVVGTLARSFPDRRRHGDLRRARPLGHPHHSLRQPSQRALRRLAEQFQLREIDLFGSAVRADFRPDSDLDVLVRPRPEAHLRIPQMIALEDELEELFDRDVDVVTPDALADRFRPRIDREAVAIYG